MTADRERRERKKKGHGNGNYGQLTCDDRDVKKRISLGKGMSGKENITQTPAFYDSRDSQLLVLRSLSSEFSRIVGHGPPGPLWPPHCCVVRPTGSHLTRPVSCCRDTTNNLTQRRLRWLSRGRRMVDGHMTKDPLHGGKYCCLHYPNVTGIDKSTTVSSHTVTEGCF